MRLSKKGEAGLLTYIEKHFAFPKDRHLLLGPGDDCAVLKASGGKSMVITTDEMVEGTHFLRKFSTPEKLAGKLMRINLSDLAAMGPVEPVSCVVGSGLPGDIASDFALRFIRALKKEALKFGLTIAGGNLSGAREMHFYMTAWGYAPKDRIVTRYGAKPGDILFNLGPLGEAKAGLELLMKGRASQKNRFRKLVDSFWKPRPFLKEGALIGARKLATAMLDNSDGLFRSARIISELSSCAVEIDIDENAVSGCLKKYAAALGRSWKQYAVTGGEDYGLIFTVRPDKVGMVKKLLPAAVIVGNVTRGSGVSVKDYEGKIKSFSHF